MFQKTKTLFYTNQNLSKCFKRDFSPRCFSKRDKSVFTDC
ncbi:hypothetical protein Gotur_026288 [Gossypium turneri]